MRTVFGFHGGIAPPTHKRQSLRTPIAAAGIPDELVLPLSQHSGAPATPVVRVGETVLKGQLIAAASGAISAALHAPTSGTVRAIEARVIAHPSGLRASCIVLAADGRDAWAAHAGVANYRELDGPDLIRIIHGAGIAGLGGAGFPTAAKVSVPSPARIRTLVINGAECEPYITCDDSLMRERASQVIEGVNILRHILAPEETLIGVEADKPEALTALRAAARDTGIEVIDFPASYPSGGEKQLIELLTGVQVPSGALPAQVGVLCVNVATAAAVYEAVTLGRPLISRITTVTGDSVRDPQNFEVLLGTPLRYLLERAGFQSGCNNRVIVGGPLMGFHAPDLDAPIVKTTTCLLAPGDTELPAPPPAQACIRCGWCEQACPASLLPQQLFWFAQGSQFDKLEQHNLFDCIECGACAYVCPSSIPLVQYYRAAKAQILQWREDRIAADAARLRFEARQQRLQRDALDKESRRASRKLAAAQRAQAIDAGGADDPIRAAVERVRARKAALQGSAVPDRELSSLEQTVATAQTRLRTANTKLAEAIAQGSDTAQALQAAVANTRAKLQAAEQALGDYRRARRAAAPAPQAVPATVAANGETGGESGTANQAEAVRNPGESERQTLALRLQHAEASLARCRAEDAPAKAIVALEATVLRLQGLIDAADRRRQD